MSGNSELFDGNDNGSERGSAPDSQRPLAPTPLLEVARGDGYRWASLEVADLDPPTVFPPSPAN